MTIHIYGDARAPVFLADDHKGMRVDYSGLFKQACSALASGGKEPAIAEMLRQLRDHMTELGKRWYAGDTAVVDELLQLYCVEKEARDALVPLQGRTNTHELRQAIGEKLTDKLGEMIGTAGPMDPYDSREIDQVLDAIMPTIHAATIPRAMGGYLFVCMDDDKVAHLTHCVDRAAVLEAARTSMYVPGATLDAEREAELNAIVDSLFEDGFLNFEGDPALHLYQLPEQIGDESHHAAINGGDL